MDFNAADKVVHPVDSEWHYPIFIKHGFVPLTKTGTGFVRMYMYEHKTSGAKVSAHTGTNADYWVDRLSGKQGYWGTLEEHLKTLNQVANYSPDK